MACLVNPIGWRLYFKRYWKTNYYTTDKYFSVFSLKTKALWEVLNSILNNFNFLINNKNFLTFNNFNIIFFKKTVFLIVKFKIYWSTFFREFSILHHKFRKETRAFSINPRRMYTNSYFKKKKFLKYRKYGDKKNKASFFNKYKKPYYNRRRQFFFFKKKKN